MKSDMDNLLILDLQKGLVKVAKSFVRRDKGSIKTKQMFEYFLRKLKFVMRKGKDYRASYLIKFRIDGLLFLVKVNGPMWTRTG